MITALLLVSVLAAAPPKAPQEAPRDGLLALAAKVERGYQAQGVVAAPAALLAQSAARIESLFPELHGPLRVVELAVTVPDARTLPGPVVLFHQGLWPYLRQIEDLLFVLAHEAAHLALGHLPERLRLGAGHNLVWELAADAEAVNRLQTQGIRLDSIGGLLDRLSAAGYGPAAQRMAALQSMLPAATDRQPDESLWSVQSSALQLWLDHGLVTPAAAFLAAIDDARTAPWRLPLALRQSDYARAARIIGEPGPAAGLTYRALAAEGRADLPAARTLWQQWLATERSPLRPLVQAFASAGCQQRPPPGAGRRGRRFAGFVLPLATGWFVAIQTGRRLVVTPDHSSLTRLDVWRRGTQPGDETVTATACARSPLGLWLALAGLRRELAPQALTLLEARPLEDGWLAILAFADAAGMQWRAMLVRRNTGSQALTVLLRAPSTPYFERHREAAMEMVRAAGWQSPG